MAVSPGGGGGEGAANLSFAKDSITLLEAGDTGLKLNILNRKVARSPVINFHLNYKSFLL